MSRRLLLSSLLCCGAVVLPASGSAHPGAAGEARRCTGIHYGGSLYPVRVLRGSVSCRRARRTLSHFFRSADRTFHGWECFYGHGQDTWAGTCIRGSEQRARVIVRAYNPKS